MDFASSKIVNKIGNVDGQSFIFSFEWNTQWQHYMLRVLRRPSREQVARMLVATRRPLVVRNFNRDRPDRPDAVLMFTDSLGFDGEVGPARLSTTTSLFITLGEVT